MSVDNQHGVAFGRRGRENRAQPVLARPPAKPARPVGGILRLFGSTSLLLAVAGAVFWVLPGIQKLNAETARAEQKVVQIVNQPIAHLSRSGQFEVFFPGWFHPGAIRPDFNNVDVRATQELPYAKSDYVTSDLNPTEMFIGRELEFNAMTKYFYTDRTLPKKRLSNAEMIEINDLYRVMGHDEQVIFCLLYTSHKFLPPDFASSPEINPPAGAPAAEFVPPCPPDVVEIYNKIWTNLRK